MLNLSSLIRGEAMPLAVQVRCLNHWTYREGQIFIEVLWKKIL